MPRCSLSYAKVMKIGVEQKKMSVLHRLQNLLHIIF